MDDDVFSHADIDLLQTSMLNITSLLYEVGEQLIKR